jgi:hypothetical protein
MTLLTKSRFMAGLQCPKRLWLEIHEPLPPFPLIPGPVLEGRRVDALARRMWPAVVVDRDAGLPEAIEETTALLAAGVPARVYQPAFRAGELAVIADIVEGRGGSVTLTEVKASTGVKEEHLPDVGFQALVMRGAGLPVDRVQVMHLDSTFVLRRVGDYEGLLHAADVTDEVEARLPGIEEAAGHCLDVMAQGQEPVVRTGPQCMAPYECPYLERCTLLEGGRVEYPVEMLKRSPAVVRSLKRAGFRDLREVPVERLQSEIHKRIHQATVTGEPFLDRAGARAVAGISYPISYLDFETVAPAIPEIVGTRPYQNLPFQFSVHSEEGPDSIRQAEFLAEGLPLDLVALAEALVAAVPDRGAVLAYNAPFENGVLRDLSERVPAHAAALRDVAERLVDLLPIARKAYYHPSMKGSWSFKAVLPSVDPSLDYSGLEGVQEGSGAQLAFIEMVDPATPRERREELRAQLLKYCGRDTWGMVVLRRFLAGEVLGE